jgi:hypothetical protein
MSGLEEDKKLRSQIAQDVYGKFYRQLSVDQQAEVDDIASEAFSAKMREGHGIGCYCAHCCR